MPAREKRTIIRGRLVLRSAVLTGLLVVSLLVTAQPPPAAANEVVDWNNTALSVLLAAGHNNVALTRGLTMVHVAIHDALNAIDRRYDGYIFEGAAEANASPGAAVATAARDVLVLTVQVFGPAAQQVAAIAAADAAYTAALAKIPDAARARRAGSLWAGRRPLPSSTSGRTTVRPETPHTRRGARPDSGDPTPTRCHPTRRSPTRCSHQGMGPPSYQGGQK